MVGGLFKSLLKSGVSETRARLGLDGGNPFLPELLGLRLGGPVRLDLLSLRMVAGELHLDLPDPDQAIVAQGVVDLGDDTKAVRYYFDNDMMLQILCVGGVDERHLEEITLYAPLESIHPADASEWRIWTGHDGRQGQRRFCLSDGTRFERLWYADSPGWVAPVVFTERVHAVPAGGEYTDIRQEVMLFFRELPSGGRNEYLLIAKEDSDDTPSIELMIGVDLDRPQLHTV